MDSSAESSSDGLNDKFRLVAAESQYVSQELIDECTSYPPDGTGKESIISSGRCCVRYCVTAIIAKRLNGSRSERSPVDVTRKMCVSLGLIHAASQS